MPVQGVPQKHTYTHSYNRSHTYIIIHYNNILYINTYTYMNNKTISRWIQSQNRITTVKVSKYKKVNVCLKEGTAGRDMVWSSITKA